MSAEPTLRERHPSMFAVLEWSDLHRDRRRNCPMCGRYVWYECDKDGREWAACSQCSWEAML